jgi:CubicO group peptidase (beta-lactamase class C family)
MDIQIDNSDFEHAIRTSLKSIIEETGIPGLAVAMSAESASIVVSEGVLTTDHRLAFSPDARFQLGCITKMLTAMVAAALIHEGKLDATIPIGTYLEDLRDSEPSNAVTISDLMSHTSGYQGLPLGDAGINYYFSWDKFREFLRSTRTLFTPGAVFNYEHTESVLLGEIIRRVTGKEVISFIREQIIGPLGLSAGHIDTDQGSPGVAVGDHVYDRSKKSFTRVKSLAYGSFWHASLAPLTLSLFDLVKLGQEMINVCRGSASLSPSLSDYSVKHVINQTISVPHTEGCGAPEQFPITFGHGAADYGGPLYGHNGSGRGQTCGIRLDIAHRISIAVGLNAWQPHIRDKLINMVHSMATGHQPPLRTERPPCPPRSALLGHYLGARGLDIVVSETDRGLKASVGNQAYPNRFEILLTEGSNGVLKPSSNTLHQTIGFFSDPTDNAACIMLGLSAFKKVRGYS